MSCEKGNRDKIRAKGTGVTRVAPVCSLLPVLCPHEPWTSYQIRKIAGCACAGNAGNVFPTVTWY